MSPTPGQHFRSNGLAFLPPPTSEGIGRGSTNSKNLTALAELSEGVKYLIMKQDIHFNQQFSSVNAWSTKRRKSGHLYAIKIEIRHKNSITVLSSHKLKF